MLKERQWIDLLFSRVFSRVLTLSPELDLRQWKGSASPSLRPSSRFIADPTEPHGDRFANWIFEKFGAGTPWTAERRTRLESCRACIQRRIKSESFGTERAPEKNTSGNNFNFVPHQCRNHTKITGLPKLAAKNPGGGLHVLVAACGGRDTDCQWNGTENS